MLGNLLRTYPSASHYNVFYAAASDWIVSRGVSLGASLQAHYATSDPNLPTVVCAASRMGLALARHLRCV